MTTSTTQLDDDSGRRALLRFRPRNLLRNSTVGIWLIVAATTASAVYLQAKLAQLEPFASEFFIPWWGLALLFGLAQVCAVHLEVRRESRTFTLGELPLVAGLLFGTPTGLLLGRLLGAGIVLVHGRKRAVTIAFNLSLFALETAIALIVLRAVAGTTDPFTPLGLAGVFAATLTASIIGVTASFVVTSLEEQEFELDRLAASVAIGMTITAANTGIALVAAQAISSQATFGVLLIAPAVVVFFGYRALVAAGEKHRRLEFLHETSRLIARSKRLETGMLDVLAHTRSMLRAEVAEIVLATPVESRTALRTIVGPGTHRAAMEPFELRRGHLSERVLTERQPLFLRSDEAEALRDHLPETALGEAMIVPLKGETTTLGTLLMGRRLGEAGGFAEEDLKLVETIAGQLGVAVENARLGKTIGRLTELSEQLKHQAFHDALTGLANRSLFNERLKHAVARQKRAGGLLAVLFIDVDDFKAVNDSRGHDAGDALLIEVAERISACVREIDTVARLGGDEFSILFEDLATDYEAEMVAERIIASFGRSFELDGELVSVSASVGVAVASDAPSPGGVLSNADVAMYRAKARGKAQFTVFEPSMRVELFRPIELRRDLRRAIEREELTLHYQPIVSLSTGRLDGVEALLRWQAPGKGFVAPNEFIPLAEETGLIIDAGRWALREACRQLRFWDAAHAGAAPLWVSVNVSRRQLGDQLVEDVANALSTSRLDPPRLVLEITESIASLDHERMDGLFERLTALGVRLALDDFGSGYSSLARLQAMPLDMLKLDHQFVQSMGSRPQATQLTRTIIELARTLGLTTVGEGIEDRDQLDLLVSLGCDLGQGFLFAKPLDTPGVEALLSRQAPGRWPTAEDSSRLGQGHLRALDGGRQSA